MVTIATKATMVAKEIKVTVVMKINMVTMIYYHPSLYDPIASDASVDPTSQISSNAILLLSMVGN
jgi:hypothetical protein